MVEINRRNVLRGLVRAGGALALYGCAPKQLDLRPNVPFSPPKKVYVPEAKVLISKFLRGDPIKLRPRIHPGLMRGVSLAYRGTGVPEKLLDKEREPVVAKFRYRLYESADENCVDLALMDEEDHRAYMYAMMEIPVTICGSKADRFAKGLVNYLASMRFQE